MRRKMVSAKDFGREEPDEREESEEAAGGESYSGPAGRSASSDEEVEEEVRSCTPSVLVPSMAIGGCICRRMLLEVGGAWLRSHKG